MLFRLRNKESIVSWASKVFKQEEEEEEEEEEDEDEVEVGIGSEALVSCSFSGLLTSEKYFTASSFSSLID